MKLGLLLIAMGFGYKVYAEASKEKGNLRSLGQWVGAIMMATSFVAGAFTVYVYSGCVTGAQGPCPWSWKKCPFTALMPRPPAEAPAPTQ